MVKYQKEESPFVDDNLERKDIKQYVRNLYKYVCVCDELKINVLHFVSIYTCFVLHVELPNDSSFVSTLVMDPVLETVEGSTRNKKFSCLYISRIHYYSNITIKRIRLNCSEDLIGYNFFSTKLFCTKPTIPNFFVRTLSISDSKLISLNTE